MRGKEKTVKNPILDKRERAKNAVYLRHRQNQPFNWADYTDSNPWSEAPSKRSAPNKRCKKGTRKHPKTKVCTDFKNGKFVGTPGKFNWADYTDSNPWSEAPSKRSAPKKRCKNGTRKHPKTKVCTDFKNGKFVTTPKMSATYDSNGSNQSVKRDRYIPYKESSHVSLNDSTPSGMRRFRNNGKDFFVPEEDYESYDSKNRDSDGRTINTFTNTSSDSSIQTPQARSQRVLPTQQKYERQPSP